MRRAKCAWCNCKGLGGGSTVGQDSLLSIRLTLFAFCHFDEQRVEILHIYRNIRPEIITRMRLVGTTKLNVRFKLPVGRSGSSALSLTRPGNMLGVWSRSFKGTTVLSTKRIFADHLIPYRLGINRRSQARSEQKRPTQLPEKFKHKYKH